MRKILLFIMLTLMPFYLSAETVTAKAGIWTDVYLGIPAAKAGGGDFYTVTAEPYDDSFRYETADGGIRIIFDKDGKYSLEITVNHITKSSCAGVNVRRHSTKNLTFLITP
jgi:hypothetical protein